MREPVMDAFEAALGGDAAALDPWLALPAAQDDARARAGLSVYRNTGAKARADALAAHYPTVERLVGAEWFRDAALIFAAEQPPAGPVMDAFGAGFPDWLERFPPAAALSYLPPVARLDAAWSSAHRAADAPVVVASDLTGVAPAAVFAARVRLHPSVRLFWFDWTVPSVWLANRPDAEPGQTVVWDETPEGLMILRPGMAVTSLRLTRAEWAFLDACGQGRPLGQAATAALRVDPATALPTLFAGLLGSGVFTAIDLEPTRCPI